MTIWMTEDEALQILSEYVKGCGGELCAGWYARPYWQRRHGTFWVYIKSTPPQVFKPVSGRPPWIEYANPKQVAEEMGLKPNSRLLGRLTKSARAKANSGFVGEETSSSNSQGTNVRRRRRTPVFDGSEDKVEAAPEQKKVPKHGADQAAPSPPSQPQVGRICAVQDPRMPLGMRGSRSSREEQTQAAVAGEQNLAVPPTLAMKWQPHVAAQLAPASGMQENAGGQHSAEEMQRLQCENKEFRDRNKILNRKLRNMKEQQSAMEEELRALRRTQNRMVNRILNDNEPNAAPPRNNSHVDQDATCIDSDD